MYILCIFIFSFVRIIPLHKGRIQEITMLVDSYLVDIDRLANFSQFYTRPESRRDLFKYIRDNWEGLGEIKDAIRLIFQQ